VYSQRFACYGCYLAVTVTKASAYAADAIAATVHISLAASVPSSTDEPLCR